MSNAPASKVPNLSLDHIPPYDGSVNSQMMAGRLRAIRDQIAPLIERTNQEADGLVWTEDHPALSNLDALIDALMDATNAKPNPLLEPVNIKGGATLNTSTAKQRAAILELVAVIQASEKVSNAEARRRISRLYLDAKTLIDGQKVTPQLLKSWQDRQKKARKTP